MGLGYLGRGGGLGYNINIPWPHDGVKRGICDILRVTKDEPLLEAGFHGLASILQAKL